MSAHSLLRQRRFLPLFITQFFGALNDNLLKNAMVILMTYRAESVLGFPPAEMVSLAGGIFILPFFLFSATAGQLSDFTEKSKLIRWIKWFEVGIMVLASIGFLIPSYGILLSTLFLMGLHSAFFGPMKYSILPQHLKETELIGGNALIEAGTFLAILIGTIGGGLLITVEPLGPWLISGAILLVSIFGLLASHSISVAAPVDSTLKVNWNPIRPTIELLKYLHAHNNLFLSVLGISWFWLLGGALLSLFPAYCKDILNVSEHVVTLFLACFSIGIGIGSILCEKLSRRSIELGLVPIGSLGLSAFAYDLSRAGDPSKFQVPLPVGASITEFLQNASGKAIVIDLVLLSIFSGLFIVPLYAYMLDRTEPSHRSRVVAANNILNALFMVVSALLLVVFHRLQFSPTQIFALLAAANLIVGFYIYSVLPEFLLRMLAWVIANLMYRMRIRGQENIPNKGAALLICNHVSFVDWLVLSAAIPRPIRFVMHYSYAKGVVGRFLMSNAKVIPIAGSKEDLSLMKSAFARVQEALANGDLVCIFPEGSITSNGELLPFRPGMEKILLESKVPVIPMALTGLWGSIFSRSPDPKFSKLARRFWWRVGVQIDVPQPPEIKSAEAQVIVQGLLNQQPAHWP